MIYIFFLIGIIAHWAFVVNSAMNKPDFELNYFIRHNWVKLLFDLIVSFAIAYNKDLINEQYSDLIGMSINTFTAPFIGYVAGDIGHRILKKFKK